MLKVIIQKANYFITCQKKLSYLMIICGLNVFNASAQSGECFNEVNLEPGFIAFSSQKDSNLGNWYLDTLGLEVAKEFAFPDGSVTGILMHKDDFVVEVFYHKKLLANPQEKSKRVSGVMKFGIYTDASLPKLKQCLKANGVNAGRIFKDSKLGIDLLQVIDPDKNMLEIISRHK